MYKFCFHIIFLFCFSTSYTQSINLVPNSSFEDTIDFGNGALEPKLWDLTLGSPDYFSSYFKFPYENYQTPYNSYGYQVPREGAAYFGFAVKNITDPHKREYIQIKLSNSLIKGSTYNVSLWLNLPDSFQFACGQTNIGFTFSDTIVTSNFEVLDRLSPIFYSDSIWNPQNKLGWEKFQKKITAKGNERYLIIGNFKNSDSTVLQNIGGGEKPIFKEQSYYFIDQVEIYLREEKDTILPPKNSLIIPNIFTPNADGINDVWELKNDDKVKEIIIFNRWGNIVNEWETPQGYWDGNGSEEGVYFYKIILEKEIKTGSFLLLR